MSPELFEKWVPAFVSTILSETPVYALFLRDRLGLGAALAVGVALQCITHPLFWLAWDAEADFFYRHYGDSVVAFELVIFLAEAGIVWALLRPRKPWERLPNIALALIASAGANALSLGLGMLSER